MLCCAFKSFKMVSPFQNDGNYFNITFKSVKKSFEDFKNKFQKASSAWKLYSKAQHYSSILGSFIRKPKIILRYLKALCKSSKLFVNAWKLSVNVSKKLNVYSIYKFLTKPAKYLTHFTFNFFHHWHLPRTFSTTMKQTKARVEDSPFTRFTWIWMQMIPYVC